MLLLFLVLALSMRLHVRHNGIPLRSRPVLRIQDDDVVEVNFEFEGQNFNMEMQRSPNAPFSNDAKFKGFSMKPNYYTGYAKLNNIKGKAIMVLSDEEFEKYHSNVSYPIMLGALLDFEDYYIDVEKHNIRKLNILKHLAKRQQTTTKCRIGGEVGIGLVLDCRATKDLGSVPNIYTEISIALAKAQFLYDKDFGVSIKAKYISTTPDCYKYEWDNNCLNYDIKETLKKFSVTVENLISPHVPHWALITNCRDKSSAVGLAYTGTFCRNLSTSVNQIGNAWWITLAHELGHSLGAGHENTDKINYLMNVSKPGENNLTTSPMTRNLVCKKLLANRNCLNRDTSTSRIVLYGSNTCMNGIVEPGEECDVGANCSQDPCCDCQCKFKNGVKCSDKNSPCCTEQCQFKREGTDCQLKGEGAEMCRPTGKCSGTNAACPVRNMDQTKCGSDLYCASGSCTNRDLECKKYNRGYSGCDEHHGCTLHCKVPGNRECSLMADRFVDGISCGYGGVCKSGRCVGFNISTFVSAIAHSGSAELYSAFLVILGTFATIKTFKYAYLLIKNK